MISGRRAIDKNRHYGEHNLVEWAMPYLLNKRGILRVLDPRLQGQYSLTRARKAVTLALQCLAVEPKLRPTMDEVVADLQQIQEARDVAKSTRKEQSNVSKRTSYPRPSASLVYV